MESASKFGLPALTAILAIGAIALGAVGGPPGSALFAWLAAAAALCATVIQRSPRGGAALTAIAAMGANGYLLWDKWNPSHGPALCSVNEVINCSAVNASEYSMLFDLPVTLLGVAFYAGLTLAALGGPKFTPRFHQINGLFAIVSLGFSAYLANASATLGIVCPFCIFIYAANLLLLWAAVRGLKQTGGSLLGDLGALLGTKSLFIVAGAFFAVVAVGGSAWRSHEAAPEREIATAADPGKVLAKYYAEPTGPVELDGTEPVLGDPNAPYVVVEYADYGCPHCAQASKEVKDLVKEFPDIQVRFKVFPLSGQCNPGLPDRGPERCLAAVAAECAGEQGKYWQMSANIFRNQQYTAPEDLAFMAKDEGLDMPRWLACVENPATVEAVVADALAGQKAGIQGTPTFFLKGTHGDDWIVAQHGVDAIAKIVEGHKRGVRLPPASPLAEHDHAAHQ